MSNRFDLPWHFGRVPTGYIYIVRPVHTDTLTVYIVRPVDVRPVHTDKLTVYIIRPVDVRPAQTDTLTVYNVRPVHTDKLTAYNVRPVHREKRLGALCSDRTKMNSDDTHHATKRRPITDPVTPLTGGALCSHGVLIPTPTGHSDGAQVHSASV